MTQILDVSEPRVRERRPSLSSYMPSDQRNLRGVFPLRDPSLVLVSGGDIKKVTPTTVIVDANGTYEDARTGLITPATANVMRIQKKGALIEKAGTNLVVESEDYTDPAWTKRNCTVRINAQTAPDGILDGQGLKEATDTAKLHAFDQTFTLANATEYEWTSFVKAAIRPAVRLEIALAAVVNLEVDLTDGSTIGSSGWDFVMPTIEVRGEPGWWRVGGVFTTGGADAGARVFSIISHDGTSATYDGTNSTAIYVWGSQHRLGKEVQSYIPTGASSVTRAGDQLVIPNNELNVGDPFTIFAVVHQLHTGNPEAKNQGIVSIGDGTNSIQLSVSRTNEKYIFAVFDTGALQTIRTSTTEPAADETHILAITAETNLFKLFVNGSQEGGTDTSGSLPSALPGGWQIGETAGVVVDQSNGDVSHIEIYNVRMTNAQIKTKMAEIRGKVGYLG